jgi:hypothetical protein
MRSISFLLILLLINIVNKYDLLSTPQPLFKCYADYIHCLEDLCDILSFDFYKMGPLKTVSDREVQTKIMQILDFEFKHSLPDR